MIRHHYRRTELVMAQFDSFVDRGDNNFRELRLLKIHRASRWIVHVTVEPNESFTGCERSWRVQIVGHATMQVPSDEQWNAFGINVGQAASGWGHSLK